MFYSENPQSSYSFVLCRAQASGFVFCCCFFNCPSLASQILSSIYLCLAAGNRFTPANAEAVNFFVTGYTSCERKNETRAVRPRPIMPQWQGWRSSVLTAVERVCHPRVWHSIRVTGISVVTLAFPSADPLTFWAVLRWTEWCLLNDLNDYNHPLTQRLLPLKRKSDVRYNNV